MSDYEVNPASMNALQDLVVAAVEVRREICRRTGLSEVELSALEHVVVAPSSPGDLARLLEVSSAASTGIVDRLERRGHVIRRPHQTDRRRTQVQVTDAGRAEMVEHLRPMLAALTELDAELDESERETVVAYLERAVAALRLARGTRE